MTRPYLPSDETKLIQLIDLLIPAYFAPEEKAEYEAYLRHEREDYYVAESDNHLVGAGGINYVLPERRAFISWDLVHPDYQGKGIGSELIRKRMERIDSHDDIEEVIVRTSQLAWKFYEKQGFYLTHTEKDYWAPGFDLYFMKMMR